MTHIGSNFSFSYNGLSCLYLIMEPSYFTQMCIDTRAKTTEITGSVFAQCMYGYRLELCMRLDLFYVSMD